MSMDYNIPYATPEPRSGSRVWAGGLILLAALALIVLGGCFLIGVMLIVTGGFAFPGPPATLPPSAVILVTVLYVLAFASFAGSMLLLIIGLRALIRVIRK